MTSRHRPTHCHACGYKVDAADMVSGERAKPRDGDVAMCFKCAEPGVYQNGIPRAPTEEERAQFEGDPRLAEMQKVIRAFWAVRKVTDFDQCLTWLADLIYEFWGLIPSLADES